MDINDIRSLVTLLSLCLFAGLMVWTWRPARRGAHDEAAQLIFTGDTGPAEPPARGAEGEGAQ